MISSFFLVSSLNYFEFKFEVFFIVSSVSTCKFKTSLFWAFLTIYFYFAAIFVKDFYLLESYVSFWLISCLRSQNIFYFAFTLFSKLLIFFLISAYLHNNLFVNYFSSCIVNSFIRFLILFYLWFSSFSFLSTTFIFLFSYLVCNSSVSVIVDRFFFSSYWLVKGLRLIDFSRTSRTKASIPILQITSWYKL